MKKQLPSVPQFILKAQITDGIAERLVRSVSFKLTPIQAALIKSTLINVIIYAANFDLETDDAIISMVEKELESQRDKGIELEQSAMDAIAQLREEMGISLMELPACRSIAPLEPRLFFTFIDLVGMLCQAWLKRRKMLEPGTGAMLRILRTQ